MAIISRIGQILKTPIGTKAAKTPGHSSNPFADPSKFSDSTEDVVSY